MKTNLLKSIFISLIFVMGVSNAWGADVQKNTIIYFDNSVSKWNYSFHYFTINDTHGWKMSKIDNTLLYVHKRADDTCGNYSCIRLFADNSDWGEGEKFGGWDNMKTHGENLTNTYNNYGFSENQYYYIKPDKSGSKDDLANLSVGYWGNDINSLNKTITVKAKVSTNGGTSYNEATSPATLTASSFKFTAYNSCSSATSLSSGTIICGYTATTTLTASEASGYEFVGWYNSAGTQQTTNKTLTINPTENTTYYAYYKTTGNEPPVATPSSKIYLTPNSNWKQANARFAAYFFGNGEKWVSMTQSRCEEGVYECEIPTGYPSVIFCRMNPSSDSNGWTKDTQFWNQTSDLTIPTDGTNCYVVAEGTWDKGGGSWETFNCTVEFTVTFHMNGHGDNTPAQTQSGKVIEPSSPSATGYTFGGWYKEANCTNAWNFDDDVTEDLTLYAKWTATEYTITYNDLYGVTHSNPATYNIESETITFAAPTSPRTGYTFAGWSPAEITKGSTGNTTVTAQWTVNQYDINYRDQGDSDFSGTHENEYPQTHTYGTSTTLKSATKQGYEFGGWFTTSDCTGDAITSLGATIYTDAITLYAKWIQQYVIVGNGNGSWLNGANWIESVIADANFNVTKHNIIDGSVTYSACPAGLKNFRIVPWGTWDILHGKDQLTSCNVPSYTNEDNNIAFVTVAKADITIGFDGTNITVNVEYDQDDLETVKSSVVTGENVMFYFGDKWIHNNVQDDPYRYHKYVNKYETTTHLVTETKGFKSTDKYLAVAILPAAQYSISNRFDWKGVSTGETVQAGAIYAWYDGEVMGKTAGTLPTLGDASIRVRTANSGLTASAGGSSIGQAPIITDYYYQKEGESTWTKFDPTDVSKLSVGIYKVHALAYDGNIYVRTAGPATLTIYDEYTINYKDQGGGNFSGIHADEHPTTHTYGTETTLKTASKTGYTFGGWHTDAACANKVTALGATTYTADITLYAQWTPNTYTVTLDRQYGEGGDGSVTATFGSPMPKINVPTRAGYTFGGYWTEAEGKGIQYYEADGTSAKEWDKTTAITLHAQWTPITYYVAFDANGGTGDMEKQTFTYNQSQNLSSNTFEKAGYHFLRWNTKPDGSGIGYADKNSVNNLSSTHQETITLYAQWEANKYRVIFNNNGGQGEMAAQYFTYGVEQVLNKNTFKKSGYLFAGWNTAADGSGTPYNDNTRVNNLTTAEEITLYAQWTAITITATLTPEEGTIGANNLTFSITSNVPTNSGYMVGVYNFGESEYAGGELSGVTSYNNNPQTHTGTPNFVKAGTFYTRAFIMLNSEIQATSDKIAFIVKDGGTTPDPEDLTWKMYDKTTELGIFTKQDENTYKLTIDVPENCTWTINYKYDQQQYYTGAESLLQERTLVVGDGQVSWQDGAGKFTITIRKEGEVWKISAVKVVGAIDITSCPEYLTTSQSLELGYRFDGIPSTWKYQVCSRNTTTSVDACYNQLTDMPISSPSTFTSTEGLSEGVHEVVIKVYDGEQLMLKSEPKRVTVEAVKQIDIFTIVDGGDPTALGQTISPTEHIGVEVTAAEKAGYIFTGWTSQIQEGQSGTITFSDASAATTTVTATADGRIYANYVNNQPQPTGLTLEVFNDWDQSADKAFKLLPTNPLPVLVATLQANHTYRFKVKYKDNTSEIYMGNSNSNEFLTKDNKSVQLRSDGSGNGDCQITTTQAGDYVFTWEEQVVQNQRKVGILHVEYPNNCTVTFFGDGGKVTAVSGDKSLTSPAKVNIGSSVTFTATPNINNQFEKWVDENGDLLSTNPTYTIQDIQNDLTVEAVFKKPTPVYLKPSSVWLRDNARFAIYYWQDGKSDGWANMRLVGCNGEYYVADLPIGYTKFKFVRLNPSTKENAFQKDVRWNETGDLTLPADGRNLFDMTFIYLGATDTWDHSKARFAAYFMNFDKQKTKWMSMTYVEGSTRVFRCLIPDEEFYDWVIFGRMNGEISTNDWNNGSVWNKTADLKLTGSGDDSYKMMGNYFTITAMQDPNNNQVSSGEWSWNDIAWSRLELPSITYDTPQNGTMTVKTVSGKTIKTGDKVAWDTDVIITLTPDAGYKVKTANISMGGETQQIVSGQRYNICGNTTIYVEYEIKEEYYLIGLDGDWSNYKEKYLFVDGKAVVELDGPGTKQFKIAKVRGTNLETRYGNVKDFSITKTSATLAIDQNSENDHCEVKTLHYGEYEFTWNPETKVLDIRFPIMRNDYRLAYQDATTGSFHPERVIKQRTTGERLDTVSFFVDHDNRPKLVLQQCTEVNSTGEVTWNKVGDDISLELDSTGVWNVVLQQTNNGTNQAQVLTGDNIKPYTGDYYIRTASAENGWMYFRQDSHKMTYSSYADKRELFSHYFCKWVSTDAVAANYTKNVKYTIANDYGDCISDTLAADPESANPRIVTDADGYLPTEGANVRFGWDWNTNKIRRAYMAGATNATAATFLRIEQAENLKNSDGAAVTEINFADLQNWIYQVDVKANKESQIKLTALYANHLQYFKGGAGDGENDKISLLSSEAKDMEFNIRLTYDFKTNHLIIAWLPDNQEAGGKLEANMMIIRKHNRDNVQVTQLNLNSELTNVKTVYGVITFAKDWIQKSPVTREQSIYWVSFPFDVKVSEIFGFGEYMDAWILQYYDGAERARKGLFADSGTYWKYIMDPNTTLQAGVGYVLVLDLNKVKFNHDVNSVSLYFPSVGEVGTITREISTTVTVPEHKCEITTGTIDHTITDSHWNLIGVPAFKDVNEFSTDKTLAPVYHQDSVSFYYEFLPNKSTYRANNNVTDFKAMYSYMVQFAGTINWNTKQAIKPAQLAARRNGESELPEKVVLGLELVQGEEKADQTFVQLQQEGATNDFDMNIDLTKIINSGANIYTLTNDRIQAAGNALPMEEAIVPVGIQIAAEGEYTFRMPDGTEGMVVELVDYETNTRTNLLLSDYIVTLPKGTSENRFALHIQPQKDVVTSLENIGEGVNNGEAVNKYLIDGKLIIRTAEGVVYDAQGKRL